MHVAIDPQDLGPHERHKMTIGSIVPRPIAWTTTVDTDGRVNLAPFSYFMGCHSYLPALALSIGSRADGETLTPKDTSANIRATGSFVVNLVSEDLVERMNISAAAFPTGVDELAMAGLSTAPSTSRSRAARCRVAAFDRMPTSSRIDAGRSSPRVNPLRRPDRHVARTRGSRD